MCIRDSYTDHCKEATAPYPGIMELLKTLQEHEIPMAIVSNKNDAAVKRLAADFFEGIISVAKMCIRDRHDRRLYDSFLPSVWYLPSLWRH